MAEAVTAFYAVETAVEGAAVGAVAVSRSTAPLHLSFRKIWSPARNREFARSGHTVNVVRGKAYVIGGNTPNASHGDQKVTVPILTLPVASSPDGEGSLTPPDFEIAKPEFKNLDRPLAQKGQSGSGSDASSSVFDRVGHTSTAIGDKLYICGGVESSSQTADGGPSEEDTSAQGLDQFVVFNTLTNSYSFLKTDTSKCTDGIPPPRMNHTATATLNPPPSSLPGGPTIDAHGTIFIHGGRSTHGGKGNTTTLRDTWAFDVGKRIWTRFPDIPDPGPAEVAGEGKIAYVNGRLWRLGDGFGRVMYLDLAERDIFSQPISGGPEDPLATSVGPKGVEKWQVVNFGTEATEAPPQAEGEKLQSGDGTTSSDSAQLPLPRVSSGLAPVTTGSGREYLIYFMGRDSKTGGLDDFWSFQIDSEQNSAAGIKDRIRDAVARGTKDSWKSGKHTWGKCEIEKQKERKGEDEAEKMKRVGNESPEGLHSFGSDVWNDQGGNTFLIWGGKRRGVDENEEEIADEGWVVTVK